MVVMIRLIVNPDLKPVEYFFEKETIIIGGSKNSEVDISLPEEDLNDIHVKLIFKDGKYFAFNQANDPFSTINGLPFGKKNTTRP